MKIKIFGFLILLIGIQPFAKADEGMWLPLLIERLNYVDMQKEGLQLTAEEIYSVNHSSLKDAIIIFGGGCTGEIISDQGLILTNHHCGYGRIQEHSSIEHDYLKDGFWAETLKDELPNPGLKATFLIRMEDVTAKVLEEIGETLTEEERAIKIRDRSKSLQNAAEEGNHYKASVRSFYEGNEYYLFVYEVFEDVRFVGAPPSSIGKFGADTDNWMWPRHTGDFSMFRVYTDKEGKPAEYSEDNIPLKPKHHLPVSLDGVEKGDFAMIMGYPGGTDRFMTSYGIKMALDISNQTVVDIRDVKLKIMMEDMQSDDGIRIKYATKYARISNYWKYFIGQSKGLKRLKVYDKKVKIEKEFTDWVANNKSASEKYSETLGLIEQAYKEISEYELARIFQREAISRGSEILGFAGRASSLKKELMEANPDQEKINNLVEDIRERAKGYFKDYNLPTDKKLLAAMFDMYYKNVPPAQQPPYMKEIAKKFKMDFNAFAEFVFAKSYFTSPEKLELLLVSPSVKKIERDPAYKTMKEFNNYYVDNIDPKITQAYDKMEKGMRLFVAGLREMQPNKTFYPDANFTMRLTYGKVLDYYPADAVHYNYYTTLKGVMEKEDPNNWEFVVHPKLKELYQNKDYGRYGEGDIMKVCFLTNHDITGGNSGSPVINGKGELIGLAFDGNWEAMSGDIAFEPELQRTINVDIRYVLFIIDKFAGAKRLIDEMDLVQKNNRPAYDGIKLTEPAPEAVEN
ncbi:MAG: S46 family peptidase [Bacteroidales bacterium]|nr:S46 family peptidase [Bacteroidales bacterium]MCF8402604.1 S46 family peptidase [Bacteroidales bacterium]